VFRQIQNASPTTDTVNVLYPCICTRRDSYGASSGFGLWANTLRGEKLEVNTIFASETLRFWEKRIHSLFSFKFFSLMRKLALLWPLRVILILIQ